MWRHGFAPPVDAVGPTRHPPTRAPPRRTLASRPPHHHDTTTTDRHSATAVCCVVVIDDDERARCRVASRFAERRRGTDPTRQFLRSLRKPRVKPPPTTRNRPCEPRPLSSGSRDEARRPEADPTPRHPRGYRADHPRSSWRPSWDPPRDPLPGTHNGDTTGTQGHPRTAENSHS